MRGGVLISELHRVFEPNVATSQNVLRFSSSGASRHLPLKGKAFVCAVLHWCVQNLFLRPAREGQAPPLRYDEIITPYRSRAFWRARRVARQFGAERRIDPGGIHSRWY